MTALEHHPLDVLVAGLAPISLEATTAGAETITRVDRKYVIAEPLLTAMLASLASHGDTAEASPSVLEIDGRRTFTYRSVYFDTGDLALHHAAATGRRRRYKVRTRTYDTGLVMLEVKTKDGRGRTIKHRREHDGDAEVLTPAALDFVTAAVGERPELGRLAPSLTTQYRRLTLVDLANGARATIDRDLVCTAPDGREVHLDDVIVETKSAAGASPLDRWLWQAGARPVRISKYCTALAVLHGHLPHHPWHRTIARHFS